MMTNDQQPNIVLVLTDDQGYGDLGCTGNPVLQTPNIDAFHEDSVRLTDFHVGPTCAPTRAGLWTGHYANSTGVWHTIGGRSLLREDEVTIAAALRDEGYATGIFGKWHLGDQKVFLPLAQGFDEEIVDIRPNWSAPHGQRIEIGIIISYGGQRILAPELIRVCEMGQQRFTDMVR